MKAILLDIEGTTTDIKFVKDVLFPYARDNVESYLSALNDEEIQEILRSFTLNDVNTSEARDCRIQAIVTEVHRQIAEDKKTTELKSLQGKIWKIAFESGSIKGHVYDDVPRNLAKWVDRGIRIYIYSSGSVEAQKLLFGNSVQGNLLEYFSGHFDTNMGHKQESQSYKNIVATIGEKAEEILFLSDIPGEVIAAEEARMKTAILDRPNNPTELRDDIRKRFKIAATFDEIVL